MTDTKRIPFLTGAELDDIDKRNAAADKLYALFTSEPPQATEIERLVAEVRHWRSPLAPACAEGEGRACGASETPTPESKNESCGD